MRKLLQFLNHQLLFCITLSYISGLLLAQSIFPSSSLLYTALFLLAAATLIAFFARLNHLARILLCMIFIATGIISDQQASKTPAHPNHIYTISSQHEDLVIIGIIDSMVEKYEDHARLVLSTVQYRSRHHENFREVTGKIMLRIQGAWQKDILPGDRVIVRAKVSHPKAASTKGAFDYRKYLAEQGIWVQGYLRSQVLIEKTDQPISLADLLPYMPERVRARLTNKLASQAQSKVAGLYHALLLGSKSQLAKETIDKFRETGVIHVLAISGLHLSLFGVMMYGLFYFLLSRSEWLMLKTNIHKLAAFLSLIPLILYSLLTGGNMPVIRALIMAAIAILAILTDRRKSFLSLISFAALMILLLHPTSIYTASFQLSFAAVITILGGKEILRPLLSTGISPFHTLASRTIAALGASLLATAGTLPLLLFHFNHISMIGPLANLVVEPLLCLWGLPFGLAAIFFMPISSTISELLLHIGSIGLHGALAFIDWLCRLPFAISLWLPAPPLSLIAVYYILLFLLLQKAWLNEIAKVISLLLFTGFVICYYHLSAPIHQNGKSEITCFSVGQGSSTLLMTPKGKSILIDGGSGYSAGYNIGQTILRSYLFNSKIRSLDYLVITHPDSDHYNGLDFIIRHFSPRHIWISPIASDMETYSSLLNYASQQGIPVEVPDESDCINFDEQASLTNLTSRQCLFSGDNNCGLVLRYQHEHFSMLFPGDIDTARETDLLGRKKLQSTILLAPHHGSSSSSSLEFLKDVRPEEIIVSSGRSKYFPSQTVLRRYDDLQLPYHLTREQGSILIESDGTGYEIIPTITGNTAILQ